jgi:prepilin peptidase CpaA
MEGTAYVLTLPAAIALIVATLALATDVRSRRIPNWLTGSALLVGLLTNVLLSGLNGGAAAIEGAGLGFALLVPFYLLKVMGAGDVKLLAALGALVGPHTLLIVAAAGALAGGVVSVIILARLGRLSLALHQIVVLHAPPQPSGAKAPYAVAIASGVYVAFGLSLSTALGVRLLTGGS